MTREKSLVRTKEAPSPGPPVNLAVDLSKPAIRKVVLKDAVSHWLTTYPIAAGVVGLCGCLLFGGAPFVIAAIACPLVGVGNGVFRFFVMGDALEVKHTEAINQRIAEQIEARNARLRDELAACRDIPDAAEYVDQGLVQYDNVEKQQQALRVILERKLSQGELTFGRFIGSAQQLALNILDNLASVVTTLEAIRGVDPLVIKRGLAKLARQAMLSASDEREKKALEERKRVRDEALEEANRLADSNEEAVTALITATANLGKMRSGGRAEIDAETAVEELRKVAQRCATYGHDPKDITEGG